MTSHDARHDGRETSQLRDIVITRHWLDHAEGSVLVEFGRTRVLCAASFTPGVPRWRKGSGEGWVTAEYAMLPRATNTRSDRESVKGLSLIHISEPTRRTPISYAVFCLKKKKKK